MKAVVNYKINHNKKIYKARKKNQEKKLNFGSSI